MGTRDAGEMEPVGLMLEPDLGDTFLSNLGTSMPSAKIGPKRANASLIQNTCSLTAESPVASAASGHVSQRAEVP